MPRPLLFTYDPPALLMSYVDGTPLDNLLSDVDKNIQKVLATLYSPIAKSLQKYWFEHCRMYGDLSYNNILCDVRGRNLFFVDPGAPNDSFNCRGVSEFFFPASRDLGYLLFEVCATNSRIQLFSRERAYRRSSFVERLIHVYMGLFVEESHFDCFLRELHECSTLHAGKIRVSWGPQGIWRHYVARRTSASLLYEINNIRKNVCF